MYHFKIKTELPRLEKARIASKKAEANYIRIAEEILNSTPEVTGTETIYCKKCGKRSQIKGVRYADWYWYERPYSCMAGDTWHFGGVMVECPKCQFVEKVHLPNTKYGKIDEKIEYEALRRLLRHATKCDDVKED